MAKTDNQAVRRIMQAARRALYAKEFDEDQGADALMLLSSIVPIEGASEEGLLAQDKPEVLKEAAQYAEALRQRWNDWLDDHGGDLLQHA